MTGRIERLVELPKPFVSLPSPGWDFITLNGISLNTDLYEREVSARNGGLDISDKQELLTSLANHDLSWYHSVLPQLYGKFSIDRVLKKHLGVKAPVSLLVDDVSELEGHALTMYQMAYANYVLGVKENFKGSFPNNCCGISGRALAVSLMDFGYPGAVYAYDWNNDHGYTMLPFVMRDDGIEGVVVTDPTSDQCWYPFANPRNATFVFLGDSFEYVTAWRGGVNLFPTTIMDVNILRGISGSSRSLHQPFDYHQNVGEFLRSAFANPQKFDIRTSDLVEN